MTRPPTPPRSARAPQLRAWARALLAALPSWCRPRVPTDAWEPDAAESAAARAAVAAAWARALARPAVAPWVWGLTLAAVVAVLFAAAPAAHAQPGVLDTVQNQYRAITQTWLGPMSNIGRRLFVALAGIEFAISGFLWLARSDDLTDVARRLLLKFILMSFLLTALTGAGVWLRPILESLAFAGQNAGVMPVAAGPSGILDMGLRFAFHDLGNAHIPWSFEAIPAIFFKLFTQIIIVTCFTLVAAQLLLVWVESYIALGAGVLFMGFAGFRATAGYAENYVNYLVYCGAQLMMFYLVGGLGAAIIQGASAIFASTVTFDMRVTGEMLAMSVTFALITLRVPGKAAARLAGGAHLGIGQALRSL